MCPLLLGILAILRPAHAQADDAEMQATVRARRPAADGATSTRIDPAQLPGEWRHAGELVALSPGALVLDFGGPLATTTASVRGAASDQVQVVFDGVPLNSSAGGGFDLSLVPAALLDGVEVRRGADARLGAGSMGGTVLLEPVRRSRALLTAGSLGTFGASASLARAVGEGGRTKLLAAADVRRSNGAFAYSRDPTPEIPDNDPLQHLVRQNNDAQLGSLLLRAEHLFDGGASVSVLALGGAIDRGLPGAIYSPTPDARQHEYSGLLQLVRRQPLGKDGSVFELPASLRGGLLGTHSGGLGEVDSRQSTLDAAMRPRLSLRFDRLRLDLNGVAGIEKFHGPIYDDRQRTRFALGAEGALDRGRVTVSAAARAEAWGDASALLPRLGASVRLPLGITLWSNVGAGFRPPSFGELYYAAGPMLSNPDLKPEHSWSGDLGARIDRGALELALTGFAGKYADLIIYELYPGFRAKPFNVGAAQISGAEASLRWSPFEGLGVWLAYTHLAAVNEMPGHNTYGLRLPYRPDERFVGRVDLARARWRLAVELQATSATWTNRANTDQLPAFADLRASGGVRLWRDVWLGAEVRNALDVQDRMTIEGYPLPGRMALLHLSWEPDEAPSPPSGDHR